MWNVGEEVGQKKLGRKLDPSGLNKKSEPELVEEIVKTSYFWDGIDANNQVEIHLVGGFNPFEKY